MEPIIAVLVVLFLLVCLVAIEEGPSGQ